MNDPKSHNTSDAVTGSECKTGVPRIEVTPEMFDAGWFALTGFESRDYPDRVMVTDVFEAMVSVAPLSWLESLAASERERRDREHKS